MKKISLLTAAILISGLSFGQNFLQYAHKTNNNVINTKFHKPINTLRTQVLTNKKQLDSLVVDFDSTTGMPNMKIFYEYSPQGFLLSTTSFESHNQTWLNEERTTYSYDANNRIIERLRVKWDTLNNKWKNDYRRQFTYSQHSYITIGAYWDNSQNQWVNTNKTDVFQDQNMLDTLSLSYSWTSQWVLDARSMKSYNTNHQIVLDLHQSLMGVNWKNDNKTEYTYDSNNNLIDKSYYNWNSLNQNYEINQKHIKGYDSQNNNIYEVYLDSYDSTNSKWNGRDSTYYNYAANGDLSSYIEYTWSAATNSYEKEDKYDLVNYDNNFPYTKLVLPIADIGKDAIMFFNHMLTKMRGYSWDGGQWQYFFEYNLYYSDFIGNGIEIPRQNTLRINPNPVKDYFVIDFEGNQNLAVEIYDANGKLIKSKQLCANSKFDVQDLNSGIYFIRVIDDENHVYTSKLIKE